MIYVSHIVNFAILYFNHRICISAGGQFVPEGTYLSFGTYSTMSIRKINKEILAGTWPSIKRCHFVESTGIDSNKSVGAPQIVLRNIKNLSFIQSSDHQFWYKNASNFVKIKKNCQVSLQNIFDDSFTDHMCSISKCANKNCKTCNILITRN
jgi:hypothetical protein